MEPGAAAHAIRREALTGVVGLYYFEQTSDDIVTVELNPPPPGVQRDSDNNKVDNNSWAVFTQWTYNFNERLGAHRGRSLHRGRQGLVSRISSTSRRRTSSRCRCSGIATHSRRSRPRPRSPIAGPTGDDLRELRRGLQGRRLEQSLQRRADAAAAGGAAEIQPGGGARRSRSASSSISRATRCA